LAEVLKWTRRRRHPCFLIAEQRVKEATQGTARQREVVAGLERNVGREYDEARELLEQFELSERILLQECDRLRTIRDQPASKAAMTR
jgi:hypothetical protein